MKQKQTCVHCLDCRFWGQSVDDPYADMRVCNFNTGIAMAYTAKAIYVPPDYLIDKSKIPKGIATGPDFGCPNGAFKEQDTHSE